ncbi:AAA family ATPase, partial [Myxococcota bacterium]|nr:AAA family ATPase [Myxococcota bacterium]
MDYLDHFGLTAEPFSNAPVSEFYFASGQHTGALERLHFVVERSRGLAILIGEIGLGKTTLARRLLESLPEDQYEAALLVIVHTGITANWLLKRIAMQLGVEDPGEDKVSILSRLFARLVEINEEGRRAVVLIDEAQMLGTRELMEEFRGLLNMEQADGKLLNFVLFGLPEIEENLRLDPPLAQRISKRLRLSALSREDSFAYVKHRMNVAGGKSDFFNEASLAAIFSFSRGVPRLINTLCDNILLELFFAREHEVSAEFVAEVAIDLGLSGQSGEELTHAKSAVDIQDFEPEQLATDDSEGSDAIVDAHFDPASEMVAQEVPGDETPTLDAAEIARQVAQEGTEEPLSDPYETETLPEDSADDVLVVEPMGAFAEEAFPAQPAQAEPFESMAADPLDEDEEDDGPVSSWAVPLPEHEETESWVVPSPVSGANDVAADEISVDEFDVDADEISVDEFDVDADEVSVEEFDVDADEISVDEFDVDTDEVSDR